MRAALSFWVWRFARTRGGGERGSGLYHVGSAKLSAHEQDGIASTGRLEGRSRSVGKTDAWELGATVAALWRAALLLRVLVLELSSRSLDDSNFVRAGVVSDGASSVTIL